MKSPSIQRYLFMRKDERGVTLTQSAFRERYGFEADGVNVYFGVNRAAVERLQGTGTALAPIHRVILRDLCDRIADGKATEKWVDLGLWPYEPADPYGFVEANLPLVERLAVELASYQEEAHQWGGKLEIVVRYASEMNDPAKPGQPWGRVQLDDPAQQATFKRTYLQVREAFGKRAPEVRFSFSPALRRDNGGERYRIIRDYWPGNDAVDVVGCTWYAGRQEDLPGAVDALKRYVADWKGAGLPFGLDEMGGNHEGKENDRLLQAMIAALEGPEFGGVRFAYASLFLEGKWGADARLAFLREDVGLKSP